MSATVIGTLYGCDSYALLFILSTFCSQINPKWIVLNSTRDYSEAYALKWRERKFYSWKTAVLGLLIAHLLLNLASFCRLQVHTSALLSKDYIQSPPHLFCECVLLNAHVYLNFRVPQVFYYSCTWKTHIISICWDTLCSSEGEWRLKSWDLACQPLRSNHWTTSLFFEGVWLEI